MKRTLLIKPARLGDIILYFPALTDAAKAYPNVEFSWYTKWSCREVPWLHQSVKRVITPRDLLRYNGYFDTVIDATGLLKHSLSGKLLNPRCLVGPSWETAREKCSSLFYDTKIDVPPVYQRVEQERQFFSAALGYSAPSSSVNYGINHDLFIRPSESPYWVFLHGTSRKNKEWPIEHWKKLGEQVTQQGFQVKLLWGDTQERLRALEIAGQSKVFWVAPRKLNLIEVANVLLGATQVVAVDTGLAHLSAALGVRTIGIYGSSDAQRFGIIGQNAKSVQSSFDCSPCQQHDCKIQSLSMSVAPCFANILPNDIVRLSQRRV